MTPKLSCVQCHQEYPLNEVRYRCSCGSLLAIKHPLEAFKVHPSSSEGTSKTSLGAPSRSGVWHYKNVVLPLEEQDIVSQPEGWTRLYQRDFLAKKLNVSRVYLKHEGENPTGSFKDRGMTVAVSQAKKLGRKILACASTGNTSASLAAYGSLSGLETWVFLPDGKISWSKLSQALLYGAKIFAVKGNFDDAMKLVEEAARAFDLYLVNSVNPFRLEGQKTILFEVFDALKDETPDWIFVPGGNLGNTSAFGKAIQEAFQAGWIPHLPKLVTVQAQGANPFFKSYQKGFQIFEPMKPETIATAIRIGDPVNYEKAKKVMVDLKGLVYSVSDQEILEAKHHIDRSGMGCETASAASLAGAFKAQKDGLLRPSDRIVCVLTGHVLKDTDTALGPNPESSLIKINPNLTELESYVH